MLRTLLLSVLAVAFLVANAATPNANITLDDRDVPMYISWQDGHYPSADLQMQALSDILPVSPHDSWEHVSTLTDELGMTHIRYRQVVNGIPVRGAQYILHIQNNRIVSANGHFFPRIDLDPESWIGESAALSAALDHIDADIYKWEIPEEEQFIKQTQNDPGASYFPRAEMYFIPVNGDFNNPDFRLTYRFNIYAQTPVSRDWVYVDASTGEILFTESQLCHADVNGTAVTAYNGNKTIVTDSYVSGYRLRESGRGGGIETWDMNEGTNYGSAVDFVDSDNYWNNVNANLDQYATDAHYGMEMTYDYFLASHNRNSFDGNGTVVRAYIHYNADYNNAFWNGSELTFGDGNGSTFTPLTALDVVAHEFTHGVTEFTAGLIYQNESGALNESFSDIFGAAVEFIATPGSADWIMGEDMTPSGNGIRSMINPNAAGDPDTYFGTSWYTGTGDNGGVHINSGVQNYWFYLLTDGASGTNDLGNPFSITGLGLTKAAAIAYRNLSVYLTPSSQYSDARFFGIQSAIDLYGACTNEVIQTTNAWYAVGVGDAFDGTVTAAYTAGNASGCSVPHTVSFTSNSTNAGSFMWYFGDGSTSTDVNPTHTYTSYGVYDVKLVVDGGACGSDSIIQVGIVDIDPGNPCIVNMPSSGTGDQQTSCSGIMYDAGGASGNYPDQSTAQITIAPPGASTVTLTFSSFNYESGYDYLYVYDGPNTSSTLIGQYDGSSLPNGGTITSSGGSITLYHYSDVYVNESGFALNWTCIQPNSPPNANFSAATTTSCNGDISFTDESTNGATGWFWNFGDGNTSTQQNPTHTYQSSGTYTVQLIAENSFGADTFTQANYITISRPVAPTTVDVNQCGSGSATLLASGYADLTWYDAPTGGTVLGTGMSYSTPSISQTTTYYVEGEQGGSSTKVGPVNSSIGAGDYFQYTIRYLIFDVFADVTLRSVWVNAGSAATRTVEYQDAAGNVIQDTTLLIPAGNSRVTLNFDLTPGTDYRLALSDNSTPDLYRNDAGVSFPYTATGLVSITGANSSTPDFYYFFYDWELVEESCLSERAAVTVNVSNLSLSASVTDASSGSSSDGSIDMTPANGIAPFTYSWSNGATTQDLSGLGTGTYSVTVTDAAACTSTASWTVSASTSCPAPDGLAATKIKTNSVELSWNAATGADHYQIRGRKVGTSNWALITVFGTSKKISNLQDNTDYEWQVASWCDAEETEFSGYSGLETFTTLCESPGNPTTINITGTTATLSWNAIPGVARYEIWGRELGSTGWVKFNVNVSNTTKNVSGLEPSTTYEWKIRSICDITAGTASSFSNVVSFTTNSGARMSSDNPVSVNVFPNPADNVVHIRFESFEDKNYSIRLLDITGKQLATYTAKANGTFTLDLNGYSSGMYLIEGISGEDRFVERLVIE